MVPSTKIMTHSGYMVTDCISEEFSRRRIYIYDKITDAMAAEICCQINHLASESKEDITLWLLSPGGSVTAGLSIIDTMESCGCDVSTVVMGDASSMAAVIASAGTKKKRYIGKNAEMMLHQAVGGASGQTIDILRTAKHINKKNNRLFTILSENTGKSVEQIAADSDRDFYLDAEEAIEYGLVDYIFMGFNG